MAGRIPQTFIDDLLDRTDIVEVVNARVSLKKTGKNYSACCPFHHEKTPSFTVSPQKQFYYCFGCGAGGNAIGFVMENDNLDFPQAVEGLAHQAGMEIPRESREDDPQQKRRKDIYSQLSKAEKLYRSELRNSQTAINYLKARGLSGTIARDYALGFAPDRWDSLAAPAENDKETTKFLEDAGMLIRREKADGYYDRFRHRIMFPIRDQRGRTIAFGGRVLGDEKPKYLNSPETPVFHKSRELYGLYEMLQTRAKPSFALVVEGYMDVVVLAQFDIRNAVATLGTSIGQPHLEKLFRHVSQVIFCFDGDAAGRKAAERALEACLPIMLDGRQASFLFLPDGEDPDSIVRQLGKEAFNELAENATSLSDFVFQLAGEGLNTENDDQKALLAHRVLPMIQRIPQGILHKIMLQRLADQTGLSTDQLAASKSEPHAESKQHAPQNPPSLPPEDLTNIVAEEHQPPSPFLNRLLSLVLQDPKLALHPNLLEHLPENEPGSDLIAEIQNVLRDYPDAEFSTLLSYFMGFEPETAERLKQIYASSLLADAPKDKLTLEFEEVLDRWKTSAKREKARRKMDELKAVSYEELTEEQRIEMRKLFDSLKSS